MQSGESAKDDAAGLTPGGCPRIVSAVEQPGDCRDVPVGEIGLSPTDPWAGIPLVSAKYGHRKTGKGHAPCKQVPAYIENQSGHRSSRPTMRQEQQTRNHHGSRQTNSLAANMSNLSLSGVKKRDVTVRTENGTVIVSLKGKFDSPPRKSRNSENSSDESSSGSPSPIDDENKRVSLPRIIKPRKRRRKDRRAPFVPKEDPQEDPKNKTETAKIGSLVTLQPYLPLTYRYDEETRTFSSPLTKYGVVEAEDEPMTTFSEVVKKAPGARIQKRAVAKTVPSVPDGGSACLKTENDEAVGAALPLPLPPPPPPQVAANDPGHNLRRTQSDPTTRPRQPEVWSYGEGVVQGAQLQIPRPHSVPEVAEVAAFYPAAWPVYHALPPRKYLLWRLSDSHHIWLLGYLGTGGYVYALYISAMFSHWTLSTPHPPQRPWVPLNMADRGRSCCIFTVMCYNVLCDKYATRQMYGYCPSWALQWGYRKKGIMEQIRHYAADIITLQEVETEQFFEFFKPELERDGYEGIFSPKSRAKTMCESERKHVDGCAIFFRTRKFKLVSSHLVEFNQLAMANHEGSDDMLNRVMTKDNIGLAALLETKDAAWENGVSPDQAHVAQPVLVCTCHIHWDPEFCDVKLIQTMMLMRELETIIAKSGFRFAGTDEPVRPNDVHTLICGDFNSLPESGVTEFLSKRRIPLDHQDFKGLTYKSSLKKLTNSDKMSDIDHPFVLQCAYTHDIMPYTNFTFDFKGVIDYIFHSKETMRTLGILGPIDQNWLAQSKIIGCPHPHIPSDHFPLLCELEMRSSGAMYRNRDQSNGDDARPALVNGQLDNGNSSSSSPSPANGMMAKR